MNPKGFTVALIGADGAGKTTLARALERSHPGSVKYLYMSANLEASDALLPTTRLLRWWKRRTGEALASGLPPTAERARPSGGLLRHARRQLKSLVGLSNRLAEEWFRQGLAWYHVHRGKIVVFDRHFYADYYTHDVARGGKRRMWTRRVHGWLLERMYPRPDLTVVLDASPAVLWRRKPEGSLEAISRRREEYVRFREERGPVEVVDASPPEPIVLEQVEALIREYAARTGARHLARANRRPARP